MNKMSMPPAPPRKPSHLRATKSSPGAPMMMPLPPPDISLLPLGFIQVVSCEKVSEDGESFHAFNIMVNRTDKQPHMVTRRYSEFAEFHRRWRSQYPGVKHVQLPPKMMFHTKKALESRRLQLQQYLRDVLLVSALRMEAADFLSMDEGELKVLVDNSLEAAPDMSATKMFGTLPKQKKNPPMAPMKMLNRFSMGALKQAPEAPSLDPATDTSGDYQRIFDVGSGEYYYYNQVTMETTWDPPPGFKNKPLPDVPVSIRPNVRAMGDIWATEEELGSRPKTVLPNIRAMGQSMLRMSGSKPIKKIDNGTLKKANGMITAAPPKPPPRKTGNKPANNTIGKRANKGKKKGKSPWRPATDPSSGDTYYYHKATGETSWEKPADFVDSSSKNHRPSVRVPRDYTVKQRIQHFNTH